MELPKRKLQRLAGYDYSQCGTYFITICTQNKRCLFGRYSDAGITLNDAGKMVSEKFAEVSEYYSDIVVEKHIVMPNHLHGLLSIQEDSKLQPCSLPTDGTYLLPTILSTYVQRFKTLTTKLYIDGVKSGSYPPFDQKLWQKSYYDHIIRDETDFATHWEYIEFNPIRFREDEFLTLAD